MPGGQDAKDQGMSLTSLSQSPDSHFDDGPDGEQPAPVRDDLIPAALAMITVIVVLGMAAAGVSYVVGAAVRYFVG